MNLQRSVSFIAPQFSPDMRYVSVFVNYSDLVCLSAVLMGQGDWRKEVIFQMDGFAYDISRILVLSIARFVHGID